MEYWREELSKPQPQPLPEEIFLVLHKVGEGSGTSTRINLIYVPGKGQVRICLEEDGVTNKLILFTEDLDEYLRTLLECSTTSKMFKSIECSFPGFPSVSYTLEGNDYDSLYSMARFAVKGWSAMEISKGAKEEKVVQHEAAIQKAADSELDVLKILLRKMETRVDVLEYDTMKLRERMLSGLYE